MPDASVMAGWESFYVIVGSSGGALIGLMFVVITLIPEGASEREGVEKAMGAFAAPTLSHLAAALLVSSLLSVPWPATWEAGMAAGVCGLIGTLYSVMVYRRLRVQTVYENVQEDWAWYLIIPLVAYLTLLLAGATFAGWERRAPFAIAAAVLVLLITGIHNAWDMVTYSMQLRLRRQAPGATDKPRDTTD